MTIGSGQVPKQVAKALVRTSDWICSNIPLWVQGAGGNVSGKDFNSDSIWIKASGLRLDQVSAKKGLVQISLSRYRSALTELLHERRLTPDELENSYANGIGDAVISSNDPSFARASMETGFHALYEMQYVAHFHALSAVIMADLWFKKDPAFIQWQEKNLPQAEFIDWQKPGFELVKAIAQRSRQPITVVRNHGVILAADSFEGFKEWENVEALFFRHFRLGNFTKLQNSNVNELIERFPQLLAGPLRFFFPDTAVFLPKLEKRLKTLGLSTDAARIEKAQPSFEFLRSSDDQDALELWLATQMLHQFGNQIEELPPDYVSAVTKLPTEKYRIEINSESRF